MPRRWNILEEKEKFKELKRLYVVNNKTIGEIAELLSLGESTIYQRLLRLGITPVPSKKSRYRNRNISINIPKRYSVDLAEFIGILLGDGHITPTQVTVTLGTKDEFIDYVAQLMKKLFGDTPKIITTNDNGKVVYIGSTVLVRWLLAMGLVFNKVKHQVGIPRWCLSRRSYMKRVIRGLIDTDGSVYRLRDGVQISFCNRSRPLLESARSILLNLGYSPSKISGYNIYLTRRGDLIKYFNEVGFSNRKHQKRFLEFTNNGRFA